MLHGLVWIILVVIIVGMLVLAGLSFIGLLLIAAAMTYAMLFDGGGDHT